MDTPLPDPPSQSPLRPGDFARVLLAASQRPARARARDQQADLSGAALRARVLNRLVVLDPDHKLMESALQEIIAELGEPAGPTRGVCTAVHQEWTMACLNPAYWAFLIAEAVEHDAADSGPTNRRRNRRDDA
jgi:hypothetical protein